MWNFVFAEASGIDSLEFNIPNIYFPLQHWYEILDQRDETVLQVFTETLAQQLPNHKGVHFTTIDFSMCRIVSFLQRLNIPHHQEEHEDESDGDDYVDGDRIN